MHWSKPPGRIQKESHHRRPALEWVIVAGIAVLLAALILPGGQFAGGGPARFLVSCDKPIADEASVLVFVEQEHQPTSRSRQDACMVLEPPATASREFHVEYNYSGTIGFLGKHQIRRKTEADQLVALFQRADQVPETVVMPIRFPPQNRVLEVVIPVPQAFRRR